MIQTSETKILSRNIAETKSDIILPKNYQIYIKPSELQISQRKLEGYQKLAEIKQWAIQNPH